MEKKFSVQIKDDAHIFIHNDLENAAWFLKEKIEERIKKNDRDGIGLEIMACLVKTAFAFEAKMNFLSRVQVIRQMGRKATLLGEISTRRQEIKCGD